MIGRTNTGGGGGLQDTDALLRVQAPAGSVVTITKGATTKTDQGHENADDNTVYDYYFIIHQSQFDSVNPWTVTATLNGDTASDTIVINAAEEYNMTLEYVLWLFKDGDTCDEITGGWTNRWSTAGTVQSNALYCGSNANIQTVNKIDISGYSKLVFEGNRITQQSQGHCLTYCGLYYTTSSSSDGVFAALDGTGEYTLEIDISNASDGGYVTFRVYTNAEANASRIYLAP